MTIIDLTVSRYLDLYLNKSFPNHDSKVKLEAYDPENLEITNEELIQEIAHASVDSPEFFIGWKKGSDIPYMWHRPMIQFTALGETNAPEHNGQTYLLEGDILDIGEAPTARNLTPQAFRKVTGVKVPKLEAWMVSEAAADDGDVYVHEDIDASVPENMYDVVATRQLQLVPKEFVGMVMPQENTARQLLRMVNDHIGENAEMKDRFRLFRNHLRIANQREGRNEIARISEPTALTSRAGRAWVNGIVKSDLAGFDTIEASNHGSNESNKTQEILAALAKSNETTQKSVEAISKVVIEAIQGKATDKAPATTIEGAWPTTYKKLMKITGVTSVTQIPRVWHELAKCNKNNFDRGTILENSFCEEAMTLHKGNLKWVASTKIIKSIVGMQFASRGNLEKGVNVFNTVHNDRSHANDLRDYNDMDGWFEHAVVSAKDKREHEKLKHAMLPKTATHFRDIVIGYYVLLRVLFGRDHPLTKRYEGLYELVEELTATLEQWSEVKTYERCLWGIHSRIDAYFEALALPNGEIEGSHMPDLVAYAMGIRHRNPLPVPDWITGYELAGSPMGLTDSPTEFVAKKKPNKKKDAENTAKNPDIKHKTEGRVALVIEKRGLPPRHDDGTELCLTFHTKEAGCKKDCMRKSSHRKLLATEAQKLTEYLEKDETNQN